MKSFTDDCLTAVVNWSRNVFDDTYKTRNDGLLAFAATPIAFARCVFPTPDGPYMNIGLKVFPGFLAMLRPAERAS